MCEHNFSKQQDFCTHLGHRTLGCHSRHYVCLICGALKSINLGTGQTRIKSAAEAMQVIYFWDVIRDPHQCTAGWRGQVVTDTPSSGQLELSASQ